VGAWRPYLLAGWGRGAPTLLDRLGLVDGLGLDLLDLLDLLDRLDRLGVLGVSGVSGDHEPVPGASAPPSLLGGRPVSGDPPLGL